MKNLTSVKKDFGIKIVLVNLDFPPISGPGVWRVAALAKYMAMAGHQVTVVCSDRSSWHSRIDDSLLQDLPSEVRVHRIHSLFLKDIIQYFDRRADQASSTWMKKGWRGIAWRIEHYWPNPVIFWALKAALRTKKLVRRHKVNCIITSGPQHFSHLAGYVGSKVSRAKWVMDYRDPWTQPAQAHDNSYQFRLNSWLEKKFIQQADRVVVVSPTWLNDIASGFDLELEHRKKFVLKLNGHDIQTIPPTNGGKHIPSRTVIHFNGMLAPGTADVFPVLLQALKTIEERGITPEDLKLSFCGLPNELLSELESARADRYVDNIGALPHSESIQQCLYSDVLMILVSADRFYHGAIPGKLYEAIALGKPILAVVGKYSDVRNLLEGYPYVVYADSANSDSVAEALLYIAEQAKLGKFLPAPDETERQAMAEKFSRKKQTDDYIAIIDELLENQTT